MTPVLGDLLGGELLVGPPAQDDDGHEADDDADGDSFGGVFRTIDSVNSHDVSSMPIKRRNGIQVVRRPQTTEWRLVVFIGEKRNLSKNLFRFLRFLIF